MVLYNPGPLPFPKNLFCAAWILNISGTVLVEDLSLNSHVARIWHPRSKIIWSRDTYDVIPFILSPFSSSVTPCKYSCTSVLPPLFLLLFQALHSQLKLSSKSCEWDSCNHCMCAVHHLYICLSVRWREYMKRHETATGGTQCVSMNLRCMNQICYPQQSFLLQKCQVWLVTTNYH